MANSNNWPRIVIDSRERHPYEFIGFPTVVKKLDTGDYSLEGFEHRVVCERKEKSDGFSCVGSSRKRFVNCLQRLGDIERGCIVIESSLADFAIPPPYTRVSGAQAVGSFISWSCRHRIPVFWCGSRAAAERVTLRWLAAYLKHVAHATKC